MKIAYICADPGIPVFGYKGCSIHVQSVIQALLLQGHQVELFATRLGGEPPTGLANLTVHQLPQLPKGDVAERENAALAANLDLRFALEREAPFDLIYERYSLWSFTGIEYAQTTNIPSILEVNAPLIEEQREHRGLINLQAAQRVARRAFRGARVLGAVSQEVASYLETYPTAEGKIYVVPNGVNPERFPTDLQPTLPRHQEQFVIGFIGTMKPWHDLKTLVDAFTLFYRENPQGRLLLVGDGPVKEQIKEQISASGCTQAVHFTGAVSPESIPGLLASMDVAVAPYPPQIHSYFSPLKVYEYMAAGLPIIVSEVGQLTELIEHQINGLLCPPGDPVSLAACLERLRSQPEFRRRLGQTARMRVQKHHTWEAVVKRLLNLADGTEIDGESENLTAAKPKIASGR